MSSIFFQLYLGHKQWYLEGTNNLVYWASVLRQFKKITRILKLLVGTHPGGSDHASDLHFPHEAMHLRFCPHYFH